MITFRLIRFHSRNIFQQSKKTKTGFHVLQQQQWGQQQKQHQQQNNNKNDDNNRNRINNNNDNQLYQRQQRKQWQQQQQKQQHQQQQQQRQQQQKSKTIAVMLLINFSQIKKPSCHCYIVTLVKIFKLILKWRHICLKSRPFYPEPFLPIRSRQWQSSQMFSFVFLL